MFIFFVFTNANAVKPKTRLTLQRHVFIIKLSHKKQKQTNKKKQQTVTEDCNLATAWQMVVM